MIRLLVRTYRTKGSPNKQHLSPDEASAVGARLGPGALTATAKRLPDNCIPTMANIESKPNNFTTIHTPQGWIAIPEAAYSYKWTKEQINSLFSNIKGNLSADQRQNVVAEWASTLDLASVPQTEKMSPKEIERHKQEVLYRTQMRTEGISVSEERKTKPKKEINYTHAWNYFLSISYREPGADRKIISRLWKEMNMDQKEHYRQEYVDLLNQGKDVHKGKIITAEEKAKINSVHQKSKDARKRKEKEREAKVNEMLMEHRKTNKNSEES